MKKTVKLIATFLGCLIIISSMTVISYANEDEDSCKHEYTVKIVKDAYVNEEGERLFSCKKCGYTYSEPISPAGHKWGEWTVTKEPTCIDEGQRTRVCTQYPNNPHYEYEVIPATGQHQYQKNVTDATCENDGEIVYTCSICGDTYKEVITATGHEWGSWITAVEPTSKHEGHQYRVCANDNAHIEEGIIAMLPKEKPNMLDYILVGILAIGGSCLSASVIRNFRILKWYDEKKMDFLKNAGRQGGSL